MKKLVLILNCLLNCLVYITLSLSLSWAMDDCISKTWFEDLDGDGFGNDQVTIQSCERPEGYVRIPFDCNDDPKKSGAIFFPGAKEPSNFDDYNCDGYVYVGPRPPLPHPIPSQKDHFIVTSFEQGHSFEASQHTDHNLNDSSDIFPGMNVKQSAYIQSKGTGEIITLKAQNIGPYDFSDSIPKIWIKVKNVNKIKDLSLYVGNDNLKNYVRFNLNSSQGQKWVTNNDWVALSISWNESDFSGKLLQPGMTLDQLRKKITDFQFRLIDNQSGKVKLQVNRISAVKENRIKYPHGVISFTFDDNWKSQYTYARPKFKEYGFAATSYVIIGFLDTPDYLTTRQLKDLHKNSKWEIGFHSFDTVMHIENYLNYPPKVVQKDIETGRQWLWENGFGIGANFAYPKGEFKQEGKTDALAIARQYFTSARTINERHRENILPADAHKLRVLYITAPKTVEDILTKIEAGIKAGEWIILVFHDLVKHPERNDQWEISKFNRLVDTIAKEFPFVPVKTVAEVLSNQEAND